MLNYLKEHYTNNLSVSNKPHRLCSLEGIYFKAHIQCLNQLKRIFLLVLTMICYKKARSVRQIPHIILF
jgi:hypothetical protein